DISVTLQGDPVFEQLFEVARFSNLTKEEMNSILSEEKNRHAYFQGLNVAREEGERRGLKRGIRRGKLEDAANLIKEGIDLDIISRSTGISLKELNRIRAKMRN